MAPTVPKSAPGGVRCSPGRRKSESRNTCPPPRPAPTVRRTGVCCARTCRAVIPPPSARGGGSIVNISSVDGLVSEPFLTVYSASKGASVIPTKGVTLDDAQQNIRCTTPSTPSSRPTGPANRAGPRVTLDPPAAVPPPPAPPSPVQQPVKRGSHGFRQGRAGRTDRHRTGRGE
ncbi:SDR family NAD(P)-dependent oxidoreductase [Streptomyces sp. NPDC001617]